ncbi:hypothetical protein OSB04_004390 [Centaurea solstitialis]|uniref:AT1G17665-like protein n=1 Tax=Centaurea solstitialis TaxID=347529 RepID=A0AA38TWX8_9ASTR|nr:hypothetical protein OSB04_004390 [Centaurea solstitialis]
MEEFHDNHLVMLQFLFVISFVLFLFLLFCVYTRRRRRRWNSPAVMADGVSSSIDSSGCNGGIEFENVKSNNSDSDDSLLVENTRRRRRNSPAVMADGVRSIDSSDGIEFENLKSNNSDSDDSLLVDNTRRRRMLRQRWWNSPAVITDGVRSIDSGGCSGGIEFENLKLNNSDSDDLLLVEILPEFLKDDQAVDIGGELTEVVEEECGKRKRKKRGRKKRSDGDDLVKGEAVITDGLISGIGKEKGCEDLVCLYPFTSSSSATQRRIKQQYDQLVKSHESNGLTLLQVGQFVNCLIEARNELKHKSKVIHRKFTITKALLFKADRSSFDRLRQQIYKLELEQKRVEEDAFVYNWLQQQLKLSPAYKKMLEIGAYMESKPKSIESIEDYDSDISFEELLAREKKDTFWQKKGRPRSGSG